LFYTTLEPKASGPSQCASNIWRIWASNGCRIRHPTSDWREYQRIWSRLGARRIEDLIDLPLMSHPAMLATLDVLTEVVTPALFTDRNLLSLVICRMVNLSLRARQQRRIVLRVCVPRHGLPDRIRQLRGWVPVRPARV